MKRVVRLAVLASAWWMYAAPFEKQKLSSGPRKFPRKVALRPIIERPILYPSAG